jgi:hypothetical protein
MKTICDIVPKVIIFNDYPAFAPPGKYIRTKAEAFTKVASGIIWQDLSKRIVLQ